MKNLVALVCVFGLSACSPPIANPVGEDPKTTESAQSKTFSKKSISVRAQWLEGPFGNVSQKSTLLVVVKNNNSLKDIPGETTLGFYATMPSMGHPMEDAGFFQKIDVGIYINRDIRFNMAGDWKMELWLQDKDYNIIDQVEWLEFF